MSKKKVKKSRGEIEADLCDLLSGNPPRNFKKKAPEFPYIFLVVRSRESGAPVILRKQDREATIVDVEYAAGYVRQYLSRLQGSLEIYNAPYDLCVKVVKAWIRQVKHLSELPKAVGFKSDPELTMTRLPFDPVMTDRDGLRQLAPRFDRILNRLTNADAFCMRVGSFYDPKADRKQAVWVSGPPDSGKSVLPWLIDELLPGGTTSVSNKLLNNSFWMAKIVGKRAVHVKEAAAAFIRTSEFKSLTGDSVHPINQKNQPMFDARIDALFFFYSNEAPEIPRDDSLIKRVIDCRMAPIPPSEPEMGDDEIRALLKPELPVIAGYCISRYQSITSGRRIPCANVTLDEAISAYEGDYLDVLEHEFIAAESDAAYIRRSEFRQFCVENGYVSSSDQSILKRILIANFGAKERKLEFETNAEGVSKRLYVYRGIRRRTPEERQFISARADRTGPGASRPVSLVQAAD